MSGSDSDGKKSCGTAPKDGDVYDSTAGKSVVKESETSVAVLGVAQSSLTSQSHHHNDNAAPFGDNGNGNGNDWGTGLCDCCIDSENCWDVFLCHPCNLAMQFNMVTNNKRGVHWPLCLSVAALDLCCTGGVALFTEALFVRFKIMERYHLTGNSDSENASCLIFLREFLSVAFLSCCTTCQNAREMSLRGEWPGKVLFGTDPALAQSEAPTAVYTV